MTLWMFTTTDVASARDENLARLFASVDQAAQAGVGIRHFVLLQNCATDALAAARDAAPTYRTVLATPNRISVSHARNLMIAEALKAPPAADDVVAFPDDDAWFPEGFLPELASFFQARPSIGLLVSRVSLSPESGSPWSGRAVPATVAHIVRLTMSSSMFFRGRTFLAVGMFDPGLGLGTPTGGGEDTDYAIRALLAAPESVFVDRALVGHPVADRAAAAKYFIGSMTVLAKHAWRRPTLTVEFVRKIAVGLYFTLGGSLKAGAYLRTLRIAASACSPRSRKSDEMVGTWTAT